MIPLRQSTEVTHRIGPYLDATDGVTPETALAATATEISKAGGAFAAGPTLGTHDAEGWYPVTLTTTHTNTVGRFVIKGMDAATHCPVWHEFVVVEEVIYDALYAASATGLLPANVTQWSGTNVATPDTAGHPKVTIKSGTGTGEISLLGGLVSADVKQINAVAAAAVRLALSAGQIIPGTVDNTVLTPTTTQFEADDITEATANHYINRVVLWTTGALTGQVGQITAYALNSGRGRFTISTQTEAPANNDTFVII